MDLVEFSLSGIAHDFSEFFLIQHHQPVVFLCFAEAGRAELRGPGKGYCDEHLAVFTLRLRVEEQILVALMDSVHTQVLGGCFNVARVWQF